MQAHISDLFFNYEHAAFDALFVDADGLPDSDGNVTDGELHAAILADATDFLEKYGPGLAEQPDPAELAADFAARL